MFRVPKSAVLISTILFASIVAWFIYQGRPFSTRMAGYLTDLKDRTPAQRENIQKAGLSLNGVILQSGETFSLNRQAGPYTEERGFVPERSFVGEKVATTPGGGVCQVASTLYNSALLAGLEIVERLPHTQTIRSVPKGMDATVAYGVADLKFRNNHPYPVKITSRILRDHLLIEIWGKEKNDDTSRL